MVNASVIDHRANLVGEAPRYIFQLSLHTKRVKSIGECAKLLSDDVIRSALTDGSVSRNGTLAGCFFAHINVSEGGIYNYSRQTIRYLSRFSMAAVYENNRTTMLSAMEQTTSDGGGLFELLAGWDIHTGGDFVVRRMVYPADKSSEKSQDESEAASVKSTKSILWLEGKSVTKFLLPDTPTQITRTYCVQPLLRDGAVPLIEGARLVGLSKCYPGIGYIGQERDVYQATTGDDHDRNGWVELLVDAGILVSTKSPLAIAKDAKVLTFYWLVPSWKDSKWANTAKTLRKNDCSGLTPKDIAVANEAVRKYVVQNVVLIPLQRGSVLHATGIDQSSLKTSATS